MKKLFTMTAVAAAFAVQAMSASANTADFNLDFTGVTTATLGTVGISGGQVFSSSIPGVASAPIGGSGNYFSVGSPDHPNTESATLTLTPNTYNYISFLWGSIDAENTLVIHLDNGDSIEINGSEFSGGSPDRSSTGSFSFFTANDHFIDSVVFSNGEKGNVAFEIDNFVASAVPEPEAYAMMLAGLGLIGFAARRKQAA